MVKPEGHAQRSTGPTGPTLAHGAGTLALQDGAVPLMSGRSGAGREVPAVAVVAVVVMVAVAAAQAIAIQ